MSFEVRTIPAFEKEFRKLSKKYPSLKSDLFKLIKQLAANPFIGTLLGKDFYKVQISVSGKGREIRRSQDYTLCKSYPTQSFIWLQCMISQKNQPSQIQN